MARSHKETKNKEQKTNTMTKNIFSIVTIAVLLAFGCSRRDAGEQRTEKEAEPDPFEINLADMHNARNSIDYGGIYTGVLPCADCEGIKTVLHINYDGTFSRQTHYLGKSDKTFERKGVFYWQDCGNIIVLDGATPPNQYFVSENYIIQLDVNGERITGDLSDHYILEKEL